MKTQTLLAGLALLAGAAACSSSGPEASADAAEAATASADSIARALTARAAELRDTAEATLATLLKDPATATWDSVRVVQPPAVDGRTPSLAVCGRLGGRPGVNGSPSPVRFVYLSKFTVFVEEAKNREQFAELWQKNCAVPPGKAVVGG